MEDLKLKCVCGQKFSNSEFNKHFSDCQLFKEKFRDFDNQIGKVLAAYSQTKDELLLARYLLNMYSLVIERKLEKNYNFKINNDKVTEITNLTKRLNIANNSINNLYNNINQKNEELYKLKSQLQSNNNKPKKIYANEIMCVNFISTDQKIHYAVPCISTDTFAEVEEKLYKEFPEYRETNNNFLANGQPVLRFKTIAENKIGKGLPVTLVVI